MNIPQTLAQSIVNNIKDILKQEVNFINIEGLIIASTDKCRIGTTHEGAIIVIKTKEPLLIPEDNIYKGAKKGINLPIYFEKKIIGVIGLTGASKIEQYAKILTVLTEMMIKEAYLSEMSFQKRTQHRLMIESLFFSQKEDEEDSLFTIDFSRPYRVILGSFLTEDLTNRDQLFSLFDTFFSHYPQTFFAINHSSIIIIMGSCCQTTLKTLLTSIQEDIKNRYQISLNFGVGLTGQSRSELKKSFETAKQTVAWLQNQLKRETVAFFEELELGILLHGLPQENRDFFVSRILGTIPEKDLEPLRLVLHTFAKHDGSIQKSAEELFIHKNTFQYQLNKIKKLTGYDPRSYHDFSLLNVAFLLKT